MIPLAHPDVARFASGSVRIAEVGRWALSIPARLERGFVAALHKKNKGTWAYEDKDAKPA